MMVTTPGFDLRGGPFRQGWDEVIPAFREQEIRPGYHCHECEMRFLCGACPAQAGMESGSPHQKGGVHVPPRRGAVRRREREA